MDNYQIIRKIGEGAFGVCYLADDIPNKRKVVIKEITLDAMSEVDIKRAHYESKLLMSLRHPNIVRGFGTFKDEYNLYIVMNYCERGELANLIKQRARSRLYLPEMQVVKWLAQLSSAMWYIHKNSLIHRDIKSQNVFLDADDNAYIGDLGIARGLNPNSFAKTFTGSPLYMSPELVQGKLYNTQSDMWSLGCVLFEILALRTAFNARNMNALVVKIIAGEIPELPSHYSEQLCEICYNLLSQSPDDRMTAAMLCKHPLLSPHIAELGLPDPEDGDSSIKKGMERTLHGTKEQVANPFRKTGFNAPSFANEKKVADYLRMTMAAQEQASAQAEGAPARQEKHQDTLLHRTMKSSVMQNEDQSANVEGVMAGQPDKNAIMNTNNKLLRAMYENVCKLLHNDLGLFTRLKAVVQMAITTQNLGLVEATAGITFPEEITSLKYSKALFAQDSHRAYEVEARVLSHVFIAKVGAELAQRLLSLFRQIVLIEEYD